MKQELTIIGLFIALLVAVPLEVYLWVKWVNPFFWSPAIAYTDIAWMYYPVLFLFVAIPLSIVGEIARRFRMEDE